MSWMFKGLVFLLPFLFIGYVSDFGYCFCFCNNMNKDLYVLR